MKADYLSWGRYPILEQRGRVFLNRKLPVNLDGSSYLPRGLGRSYGDVCLSQGGDLLLSKSLDNFISFDKENGILRAEAGVSLEEILKIIVPAGFFLPVTPGTKFVSLGGAVANDVHGKNHHCSGTFGRFVKSLRLWRSDMGFVDCSPTENKDLFEATISGLGLTGFITEVEFELKKINNHLIDVETHTFKNLDEFFELSKRLSLIYEYTVAWLDCLSSAKNFRGVFFAGRHAEVKNVDIPLRKKSLPLSFPFNFPKWALNNYSMRCFNEAYFRLQSGKAEKSQTHYDPFFYPLDGVKNWNRMYGACGFTQFQCVLPNKNQHASLKRLLGIVANSRRASFLTVLKEFGAIESPGLLSFPRAGDTICLDFSLKDRKAFTFVKDLEEFVCSEGGALYPAKDAFMQADSFKLFYPNWERFSKQIDPAVKSCFWDRVFNV